ncbi:MAG: putative Transcriptional regulator [Blastococcus sp.]|jgi:PadR family transcriptional regulator PadR|nr:putative Transcriptional regulator [Blastococcus sp.]
MAGHDPQMLKGVLPLLLLRLVADAEDYGYSIVLRLHELGLTDLTEGTVYPALTRLESRGLLGSRLVRSASGPARKYYEITPAGSEELARGASAWTALADTVRSILSPATAPRS